MPHSPLQCNVMKKIPAATFAKMTRNARITAEDRYGYKVLQEPPMAI